MAMTIKDLKTRLKEILATKEHIGNASLYVSSDPKNPEDDKEIIGVFQDVVANRLVFKIKK